LVTCRIRRGGRKQRARETEREKEEEEEETVMKQLGLLPGCSFRKRNLQRRLGRTWNEVVVFFFMLG
jgi:NAD(P)H-nitrite reductase large subunit